MGGKLGVEVRSSLSAEKMSDLAKYSVGELQARFGDKTGYASQLFHGYYVVSVLAYLSRYLTPYSIEFLFGVLLRI